MATGLFRNAVFLARASAIPNEGMSTYTICRSIIPKTQNVTNGYKRMKEKSTR